MPGILDLLGLGGGGQVSGVTPPGQGGGGLFSGLSNFAGNNSDGLIGLGAGIASGNGWGQGISQGLTGFGLGSRSDDKRKKDRKAENATQAWLATQTNLSPEQRAYLDANPDAAATLYAQTTAPKAPVKLGQGDVLLDPTTMQPMYTAPAKPSERGPKTENFFNPETGQNEVRQWDGQQWQTIGLATKPAIQQKPLTEGQSNAQGFAERMEHANRAIEQFGATEGTSRMNQAADAVPFGLGTGMKSAAAQQYDQAQRSFVNAVLRKESGAAISEGEFENAKKQYFPQPGEGPEVQAQKAQERRIAIENMKRAGSNAPGSQASGVKSTAVTTPDGYTIEPAD